MIPESAVIALASLGSVAVCLIGTVCTAVICVKTCEKFEEREEMRELSRRRSLARGVRVEPLDLRPPPYSLREQPPSYNTSELLRLESLPEDPPAYSEVMR